MSIAAATKPRATVDTVLGTLRSGVRGWTMKGAIVPEIDRGLSLTTSCRDFRDKRNAFDSVYSGTGMPCPFSYAIEAVTKDSASSEW
jgi:hypothetical protein